MLDLNNPKDARELVESWYRREEDAKEALRGATEQDVLNLAKQIFLYCDPLIEAYGHLKEQ